MLVKCLYLKHFSLKKKKKDFSFFSLGDAIFLQKSLIGSFFLGWKSQRLKNTLGVVYE